MHISSCMKMSNENEMNFTRHDELISQSSKGRETEKERKQQQHIFIDIEREKERKRIKINPFNSYIEHMTPPVLIRKIL